MNISFLMQQIINGLSRGAVYALIAVGFALIFSVLKFSNFAHGGLISVSAFAGYFLTVRFKLPVVLAIIFTAAVGSALGLFLDFIAFRNLRRRKAPSIFYFVSSITCGILFMNLMTVFFGSEYFSYPPLFKKPVIALGKIIVIKADLLMMVVSLVLLTCVMLILNKTRLGLAIRSVAIDGDTAMLMGINSSVVVSATFIIAGALAGISGYFLASSFTVDPFLGSMVVKGFVASVIGGLGSLPGAMAGAVVLGVAEVLLTTVAGDIITPAIIFVAMLVFLMIRPQGISGKFVAEKA